MRPITKFKFHILCIRRSCSQLDPLTSVMRQGDRNQPQNTGEARFGQKAAVSEAFHSCFRHVYRPQMVNLPSDNGPTPSSNTRQHQAKCQYSFGNSACHSSTEWPNQSANSDQ